VTKVNLLPPEIIERQRARQKVAYLSGGMIVLSIFLLLIYLMLIGRVYQESQLLSKLKEDNQQLEAAVSKYKPYEEDQKELERRKAILRQAMDGQILWSHILNEISMVIPSDVWLTKFSGDASSGVLMDGYTFDHPAVAKWMIRQGEVKKFSDIELGFSQKAELEGQEVIQFETSAGLVGVKPATKAQSSPGGK